MHLKRLISALYAVFCLVSAWSQESPAAWLRAFPITGYQVALNDSQVVIQVELPPDMAIRDKQAGVLTGIYRSSVLDTGTRGSGRCQLIKAPYHYFAIRLVPGVPAPQEGDLLYTLMDSTPVHYGLIPRLAGHFILLRTVEDQPLYDRFQVFRDWSSRQEHALLDSLVRDIRFTGTYFMENDPSADRKIEKGTYAGQQVLTLMKSCRQEQVLDFLRYMLARPRLYAGREWKISEIFATWLQGGAPTVQPGGRKG